MSGDYSRFTFDARKRLPGVLQPAGPRPTRRGLERAASKYRAAAGASETLDIVGPVRACRRHHTRRLPDHAHRDRRFDIGIGRMYVDGISGGEHGLAPLEYRADLGEARYDADTYSEQPYLPAPLPPPLAGTPATMTWSISTCGSARSLHSRIHRLREMALGGADTTTRMQTVWQVARSQNVGRHGSAADDIADLGRLIAPSAGRLTTRRSRRRPPTTRASCPRAAAIAASRTGSTASRSTTPGRSAARHRELQVVARQRLRSRRRSPRSVGTTQITVSHIGRDQILRFAIGDWVRSPTIFASSRARPETWRGSRTSTRPTTS